LFLTAASFVVKSEAKQPQRNQSAPTTTGMDTLRIADEETSAPATGAGESQKSALPLTPPTTLLDKDESRGILGTSVRSATNEDMGRVVDVIVDRSGITRAAVIDFGGFLGVGSRKIAVDWNALRFVPDASKRYSIALELSREQVKAAPEYKQGEPIVVLGPSGTLERIP
jgi:PRC-barrel domain